MQIDFEDDDKAEVSMSPLIDCVFLLLIFFLVATMTKKANKDVDIRLPESTSAVKRLATDDQAVIGVDEQGNVYFEGKPASGEIEPSLKLIESDGPLFIAPCSYMSVFVEAHPEARRLIKLHLGKEACRHGGEANGAAGQKPAASEQHLMRLPFAMDQGHRM